MSWLYKVMLCITFGIFLDIILFAPSSFLAVLPHVCVGLLADVIQVSRLCSFFFDNFVPRLDIFN